MDITKVSSGKKPPQEINVCIEIPQGSNIKYELDKDSGAVMVDRFLHTAMYYPCNYGFIPGTKADDGDPVDVLVISVEPVAPGSVIPARPVGMLEMEDEAGIDHKILAVPTTKIDPTFADIKDIADVNEHLKAKLKHFFERYKDLEPGKWVKIKEFHGREAAEASISKGMQ